MTKVKFFMGTANSEGMNQLSEEINSWIEKEKVEIKNVNIVVRDISPSEQQTLGAEIADQLIVNVIYTEK